HLLSLAYLTACLVVHILAAPKGEVPVYREIFVPVDNSSPSDWAVDRAIELCRKSDGRIDGNHVYAARLHDVRFRQLEPGLPARSARRAATGATRRART